MLRRFLCVAAIALPLLGGASAFAQDGGVATWSADDFAIRIQSSDGAALSAFDLPRFFNKQRCDCDETVKVFVGLTESGFAKKMAGASNAGSMQIGVGPGCASSVLIDRQRQCLVLDNILFSSFLTMGTISRDVSARVISTDPTEVDAPAFFTPNPTCTLAKQEYSQTVSVALDANNDGVLDTPFSTPVRVDLSAPPSPVVPFGPAGVSGGNQAVIINWEGVDIKSYGDLIGYQVLCHRAEGLQVFDDGTFEPEFKTCINDVMTPVGVMGLNPNYVCSPLLAPATRSFRVKILQNDIPYAVAVVAVDKSGNASSPEIIYGTPIKTNSFYDIYRDGYEGTSNGEYAPGQASGGFCTLVPGRASTGTAFGIAGAAVATAMVIARRRRRR
jgi:hypothetical protein